MTERAASTEAARRSFEAFWEAERQGLYAAVTMALGNADLATEAVDEAFVRAYTRWEKVGEYDNPAGWIYRVAVNWARSWLRRATRRPHASWEGLVGAAPVAVDTSLVSALSDLPRSTRDAIVLRYYLDWPVTWIAGALDAPEGTVKSWINRGLKSLRSQLEVSS